MISVIDALHNREILMQVGWIFYLSSKASKCHVVPCLVPRFEASNEAGVIDSGFFRQADERPGASYSKEIAEVVSWCELFSVFIHPCWLCRRARFALHLVRTVCFFLHFARVCTMSRCAHGGCLLCLLLELLELLTLFTLCSVCCTHCLCMFANLSIHNIHLRFSSGVTSLQANSLICWLAPLLVHVRLLIVCLARLNVLQP